MMSEPRKFRVSFDGEIMLTSDQIWPDGDGPDEPTAIDVAALMRREGTICTLLQEWNLDDALDVYVDEQPIRLVAPSPKSERELETEAMVRRLRHG